jgi:hypothetical protein
MNTELDDLYQAILDAINASYDYMPSALANTHGVLTAPTREEIAAQADGVPTAYDALGNPPETESRSSRCTQGPRSVRWWNR